MAVAKPKDPKNNVGFVIQMIHQPEKKYQKQSKHLLKSRRIRKY